MTYTSRTDHAHDDSITGAVLFATAALDRVGAEGEDSRIAPTSHSTGSPPPKPAPETIVELGGERDPMVSLGAELACERTREALFGTVAREHTIHRYTVLSRVGAGGMGVVYAAYDPTLDRQIALKLLHTSELGSSARTRERMLTEARALAKVSHPNVVSVFEVGVWGETEQAVFVAMEFVRGKTLREWGREARPDWRAILDAYVQAARGLAAVHRMGLVHRDFKPDNAMIDEDGRVRVMDFGLAREEAVVSESTPASGSAVVNSGRLTQTGALVGTPAYMAPEQLSGTVANARSDQWAFCVSLYEALWGRRPYEAATLAGLVAAVLRGAPPQKPTTPTVPRRVRNAIFRGLAMATDARWPSLDALADALDVPSRRRSQVLGTAAIATVLVGGGLAYRSSTAPAPCKGSDTAFAEAWNPDQESQLRAAFTATGLGWADDAAKGAVRQLDGYADAWTNEHRAACRAAQEDHTQSDAMFDRRMRCLEHDRRDFAALLGAFANLDETGIERADVAIGGLARPQRCADEAFVDNVTTARPPIGVAAAVDDLRARLAALHATQILGRAGEAYSRSENLIETAASTHYAPVIAEADLVMGELQLEMAAVEPARAHLERAYFGARTLGDRGTAARAAKSLASLYGTVTNEIAIGRQWVRLAEVELEPGATEERAGLESLEVTMLLVDGHPDDALDKTMQLLERAKVECTTPCEALPNFHGKLARIYTHVGRVGEAEDEVRTALELESSLHQGDHPHRANMLTLLGDVLQSSGRLTESLEVLQAALAMRERLFGPDHYESCLTRVQLANTLAALGRGEEAVRESERAIRGMRVVDNPSGLATALNELGGILIDLERFAEARVLYAEALSLFAREHPDGDPMQALVLSNLALIDRALGNLESAVVGNDRAFAMRVATVEGHDPMKAILLINAGRALLDLGRNAEAIPRLRQAIEMGADEDLPSYVVAAEVSLWKALVVEDPAGAAIVLTEARARCARGSVEAREAAACGRLDALEAPPSTRRHAAAERVEP